MEQNRKGYAMKREKNVGMTITEDERQALLMKIREKENELNERLTISSYLREYVLKPHLNGVCSPTDEPSQDTETNDPFKDL